MASQDPLKDEVHRRTVAVEHVQSGVIWVGSNGKIRSVNASFANTLGGEPKSIHGRRLDGSYSALEVLMVAIHGHKMRLIVHHCLILDRTRERVLEAQLQELRKKLDLHSSAAR